MKFVIASLFCCLCLGCFGQDKGSVDSLKSVLNNSMEDTAKLSILWKLGELYSNNNYAEAIKYAEQALAVAENIKSTKDIVKAHRQIGNNLMFLGSYDKALQHYLEAMSLLQEPEDNYQRLEILNNLGALQDRLGN